YIVYDGDLRAFRGATGEVKKFLKGRVHRTVGVRWPDTVIDEISAALAREFARYTPRDGENCLAVIVIADLSDPNSPYVYDGGNGHIVLCESRLSPGRSICVDVVRLLERVWLAKAAEGAEMGSRAGPSLSRFRPEAVQGRREDAPWPRQPGRGNQEAKRHRLGRHERGALSRRRRCAPVRGRLLGFEEQLPAHRSRAVWVGSFTAPGRE